jgi:choline kinase
MAAGMGTRFGGLKQIAAVGPHGESLMEYSIFDAIKAGLRTIIFVIRTQNESAFRERFGKQIERHAHVLYAYQENDMLLRGVSAFPDRTKPWGTAHAVLCAREAISGAFGVINADDFYGAGSFELLHGFLSGVAQSPMQRTYCMCGYLLENTLSGHGPVSRAIGTL